MNKAVKIVGLIMCILVGTLKGFIQAAPLNLNINVVKNNVLSNSATPEKYDLEIDGIFYQITSIDNLKLKVVGGENVYSGDIVIPDEVDYRGKKFQITSIDYQCFYNSAVTTVKLGDNISSIGSYAFYGSTIREIVIPASVKTLYEHSFDNCQSLTKLTISDGTDVLDFYSSSGNVPVYFVNCPIEYLYIGRNIDHWPWNPAFEDLSNATEIKIGSTVTEFDNYLLSGASKITSLIIPQSVKILRNDAFNNCSSLKSVIFEDGEETVIYTSGRGSTETGGGTGGSVNYAMFCDSPIEYLYIGRNFQVASNYSSSGAMFDYTPVKKLEIGSMVTTLIALRNLRELSEIKLPKNVENVSSFSGCNNLRKIICDSSVPPSFKSEYSNFSNIVFVEATLYVPKGCVGTYQMAEVWKNFFEITEYDENAALSPVITDESVSITKIFDINGQLQTHLQKGLNIIIYSDGSVKKVIY